MIWETDNVPVSCPEGITDSRFHYLCYMSDVNVDTCQLRVFFVKEYDKHPSLTLIHFENTHTILINIRWHLLKVHIMLYIFMPTSIIYISKNRWLFLLILCIMTFCSCYFQNTVVNNLNFMGGIWFCGDQWPFVIKYWHVNRKITHVVIILGPSPPVSLSHVHLSLWTAWCFPRILIFLHQFT